MRKATVTRIPGVFPIVEIERDVDGWAKVVTITGTMDKLVITAKGDSGNDLSWLDVEFNGEDMSVE
jgi:hypothetical protein